MSEQCPLTTTHSLSWVFPSFQTLKRWLGTCIVFSRYGWMPACSVSPFLTLTFSWLLFFLAQFIICWKSAERTDGTVSGLPQWLPGGGWRRAWLEGVAWRLQGRQPSVFQCYCCYAVLCYTKARRAISIKQILGRKAGNRFKTPAGDNQWDNRGLRM